MIGRKVVPPLPPFTGGEGRGEGGNAFTPSPFPSPLEGEREFYSLCRRFPAPRLYRCETPVELTGMSAFYPQLAPQLSKNLAGQH